MSSKRFGCCYMGSKSKIAGWVVDNLPKAAVLVDLFAGGGAITHAAMLKGKYDTYIANDIDIFAIEMFQKAIKGDYSNDTRWISRGDFNILKNSDPIVRYCWSFGNNPLKGYMYAKSIEPIKKAMHHAIHFDDHTLLAELNIDSSSISTCETPDERYQMLKKIVAEHTGKRADLASFERLQSLERVQSLQPLMALNKQQSKLKMIAGDYRDVVIPDGAVVYCDIPYSATTKYSKVDFNHNTFYDWCEAQSNLVVISEQSMPDDRFVCVATRLKTRTMCATDKSTKVEEKLFVPVGQLEMYNNLINKKDE